MKISIIVPVYNVEKYLKECVESVLSQSYKDLELILVDDGSTDGSPKLCDEYVENDSRVIVIHKPNGGLSDARNCGICRTTGEYLLFLDSDDFWNDANALARLVERAAISGADVINYSYIKYYEDDGKTKKQFDNIPAMNLQFAKKEEQLKYICGNFLYIASACNKMIRKNVFTEQMMFEKGRLSEDVEWCARLLAQGKSFDFVCENFYVYRQRSGSITHTMAEKACLDLTNNIEGCLKVAEQSKDEIRKYIYMYTAYQLSTFFAVQAFVDKCPESCLNSLAKCKWLLNYHGSNRKITILFWGCKILGFKGLCHVIRLTKKIWS